MNLNTFEKLVVTALITASIALSISYLLELGRDWQPCKWCLYQRYGYIILLTWAITAMMLSIMARKIVIKPSVTGIFNTINTLAIFLIMFCVICISLFHLSIEYGWIDYTGSCASEIKAAQSIEEFKSQISEYIPCNKIRHRFLGVSLTFWSALYGIVMFAVLLKIRFYRPYAIKV